MNNNYFDYFSKAIFSAFYNVAIYDVKKDVAVFIKLTQNPELEGVELGGDSFMSFMSQEGIDSIADRHNVFEKLYSLEERCEKHVSGPFFSYRTNVNGKIKRVEVEILVPEDYGVKEHKILFCARLLDDAVAMQQEVLRSVEETVVNIAKIHLDEKRIEVIGFSFNENHHINNYEKLSYSEVINHVAEHLIYPEDRETYLKYMNSNRIRKYYMDGYSDYGFLCRRKLGNIYNWVYVRITPAYEYTNDNMVFFGQIVAISESVVKYISSSIEASKHNNSSIWDSEYEYTNYVERISRALNAFTSQFETYLEVDLKSNRFISFKGNTDANGNIFPTVGVYPLIAKEAIDTLYEDAEAEKLLGFINLDNVKDQLVNETTISDNFRRKSGELIGISFSKTESVRGIPSKVCVMSWKVNENSKLLKVKTFGNFEVLDAEDKPIHFEKKQSKQVLAYLIDKLGYPVSNADIVSCVLEKDPSDLNARKYASALIRKAMRDLENAGYPNVIIKDSNNTRINKSALDCDYYHLLDGNIFYWGQYHNEYMKEYSWAEETNSELAHFYDR